MSELSEQLERLINRSLDHDLSDDEQLELDRELIRDPAARRVFDEYVANDKLAAAELHRVFGPSARIAAKPQRVAKPARLHPRTWWLATGAIAASLLAMVVPFPQPGQSHRPAAPIVSSTPGSTMPDWATSRPALMQPARSTPLLQRDTGKDVIGVLGDDGNLYWIEVERTRTIKLPPQLAPNDSL